MTEKIRVGDQWYVSAKSARAEENPHVLKHDEIFVLLTASATCSSAVSGNQGLYQVLRWRLNISLLSWPRTRPSAEPPAFPRFISAIGVAGSAVGPIPQLIAPRSEADGDQLPTELTWHNFLKLKESQSVRGSRLAGRSGKGAPE